MTLLFPLTFGLDPAIGIIMLTGIFYGAMYGGSTTSILVRIPGEAASVVTCIDGYEMARKGRAGPALMIAALGSFVGGTVSILGLMFITPPLAKVMIAIGPSVQVVLILLALAVITAVSGGSRAKTAAMIALGLALATVGLDRLTGIPRFTFGSAELTAGLSFTALAIGLFGISEILINLENVAAVKAIRPKFKELIPRWADLRESAPAVGRASVIGCRRTGNRQQRSHRHRHDPAARARDPIDPGNRAPHLSTDNSWCAARSAAADRSSRGLLGAGGQHVRRQRDPAHSQSPAGRDFRQPAAHSLQLAGSDNPDHLGDRSL
jgi:hypothetical protein